MSAYTEKDLGRFNNPAEKEGCLLKGSGTAGDLLLTFGSFYFMLSEFLTTGIYYHYSLKFPFQKKLEKENQWTQAMLPRVQREKCLTQTVSWVRDYSLLGWTE